MSLKQKIQQLLCLTTSEITSEITLIVTKIIKESEKASRGESYDKDFKSPLLLQDKWVKRSDVLGVLDGYVCVEPSHCAKLLFKFLLENKGAKYTKSQLAVLLGYKNSKGGVWSEAFRFLKQNNLINTNGKLYWVD